MTYANARLSPAALARTLTIDDSETGSEPGSWADAIDHSPLLKVSEYARPVAALYVETRGCYFGLPGVDPWDEARDARLYDGPHPVVAHPPCQRWGRYWGGSPTTWPRLKLGDDGGCFEAALAAVRKWGGVLEHPEGSHAWRAFDLNIPPRNGGWVVADWQGGWTCCVEQGAYGHKARKATWLYTNGVDLPSLDWGRADGDFLPMDQGFHSAGERLRWRETGQATDYIRRATRQGILQRLSKRERAATPEPFRDLLLSIARTAKVSEYAPNDGVQALGVSSLLFHSVEISRG